MGRALRRWGMTMAGGFAVNVARHPDRVAVVDERGQLTFEALYRRSNALAHGLLGAGIRQGMTVAVMCRNHNGFVETTTALAKLGANTLYLNTGFAAPQLHEVVEREGPGAIVFDQEFASLVEEAAPDLPGYVAWHDVPVGSRTLDALILAGHESDPPSPTRPARTIILTSGTTGSPRGVPRAQTSGVGPAVALLSGLPLRAGDTTVIAAPLFHAWGFGHLAFGLLLGSTVVIQRRFDPVDTLEAVARHRASVLVAVPVMLQRMLEVPAAMRREFDTSSLRAVIVSGSSLPGSLAPRFMDAFGDVLYNLYGSTEVAYATVATPEDLRANPRTAGRPLRGTTVVILDADGCPVPPGERNRIFVANELLFEGYTGGGRAATARGVMRSGDVGRFDANGCLVVEGREDDMIVSGGENIFPEEIEHLLADHEAVAEAAVVGVPDEEFGQRLKAFIVRNPGVDLTTEDVRAYVRSRLARYKVPRDVEFVKVLPHTTTGKVRRDQLREPRAALER
jgi:fatty-acyl-CoA synthase